MIDKHVGIAKAINGVVDDEAIHEQLLALQNMLWDRVCCPITMSGPGIITTSTYVVANTTHLVEFNVVVRLAGIDKSINVLNLKCLAIGEDVKVYPITLMFCGRPENTIMGNIGDLDSLRSIISSAMPDIMKWLLLLIVTAYQPIMGPGVYEQLLTKFKKR